MYDASLSAAQVRDISILTKNELRLLKAIRSRFFDCAKCDGS